jgi:nitrogenase molybdenum-cofactor synthesis protein NifE
MMHLAEIMKKEYGIPYKRVSYFGIEDMSKALYDVAEHFRDHPQVMEKAKTLVKEEIRAIHPVLKRCKERLSGKKAAIYVGGAFKAFSMIKALRSLGMDVVLAGSQTGNKDDYKLLKEMCDEGTVIVDDANPLELSKYSIEKGVEFFIGGVKERPMAFKLGIGFCDHNHERKLCLAGYSGMLNFAREVYASALSPVWQFAPERKLSRDRI